MLQSAKLTTPRFQSELEYKLKKINLTKDNEMLTDLSKVEGKVY